MPTVIQFGNNMGKQQEELVLDSQRRKQLDANIRESLANGASNEDVAKYAQEFKSKFGVKKKASEEELPTPTPNYPNTSNPYSSNPFGGQTQEQFIGEENAREIKRQSNLPSNSFERQASTIGLNNPKKANNLGGYRSDNVFEANAPLPSQVARQRELEDMGKRALSNYTPEQQAQILQQNQNLPSNGVIQQGYDDSELTGNRGGYLYNKVLEGFGQVASGVGDFGVQLWNKGLPNGGYASPYSNPMSDEERQSANDAIKDYRENVAPTIRGYLKDKIGANVDKRLENKYNNETVTSAFGGLSSSLPSIAATVVSGGAGTVAIAAQMFDNSIESINSTELGRSLDEDTKTIFGVGVATVSTLLEKYGLEKILKSESGIVSDWIAKKALQQAVRQTDGKVTSDVFSKFLNKEVLNLSNKYVNGGARALDGALTEYGTEFAQEGASIGGELLVNKSTGKSVFDTKNIDSWDGFVDNLSRANKSGIAGFIAGGGLGAVSGIFNLNKSKIEQTQTMLNEVDKNLQNENLSESAKNILVSQKVKLQTDLDGYKEKIDKEYDSLSKSDKEKVNDVLEQQLELQEAINDPEITPEMKANLEAQSAELEKSLKDIKPQEQVTFEYESIDEVPESLKDKVTEEDGKITITLPKTEADALQQRIKDGLEPDMTLKEGRVETLTPSTEQTTAETIEAVTEPKTLQQLEQENRKTLPKVPTKNVFVNEVEVLEPKDTKGVDAVINEGRENELPSQSIKVSDIVPTQRNLTISNLEETQSVTDSNEPIILNKKGNKYYVVDGHHRIANEILKGNNSIEAKVFSPNEEISVQENTGTIKANPALKDVESTEIALNEVEESILEKLKTLIPKFSIEKYIKMVLDSEKSTNQDKVFIKYQEQQEKNGVSEKAKEINDKLEITQSGIFGIYSWKTKDGAIEVKKVSKGYGFSRKATIPDYYEIYNNGKLVFKTDSYTTAVNYTVDYLQGNKIPTEKNEEGLIYHQKANEASESVSLMGKGERFISEAYHKAKADGSNPELVKAVEELIGKAQSEASPVSVEETSQNEVLVKAETDLEALKQVSDKAKKYTAAVKRLNDAFREGRISEQEFNDTKARFDDVIADSLPNVPKITTLSEQEVIYFNVELESDEITVNDIIDYEKSNATEQLINEDENVPKAVQERTDDGKGNVGEGKTGEGVSVEEGKAGEKAVTEPKQSDKATEQAEVDSLINQELPKGETRQTQSNVERERGKILSDELRNYSSTDFKEAANQSYKVVDVAKKEFGDRYVEELLPKITDSRLNVDKKRFLLIALENDLNRRLVENPSDANLIKLRNLVTKESIELGTQAATATAAGVLRQENIEEKNRNEAIEKLFDTVGRQNRNKIREAVESTTDAIQTEYEAQQSKVSDEFIEQAIQEGVEKRFNEIYESLPSKRRQQADKAIKALESFQKKLRSKTYDASIGVPIAILDAGISTIKAAIKSGYAVADAVEAGIKAIKKKYGKKWDKEDIFRKDVFETFSSEGVDISSGTKISSADLTPQQRLQRLKDNARERMKSLEEQIAEKRRELKEMKITQPDAELKQMLAEERALKKELNRVAPLSVDEISKKRVPQLEREIAELDKQINDKKRNTKPEKKNTKYNDEVTALQAEKEAKIAMLNEIDPIPKQVIKEALIDAGYSKEINTKDGKRNVLDWGKIIGIAGDAGRIETIVRDSFKNKGWSDADLLRIEQGLIDEVRQLRQDIAEKSINELDRKNVPTGSTSKILARRLANLYDLGLFAQDPRAYEYLINKTFGATVAEQTAFEQIGRLTGALSKLMQQVDPNTGMPYTDMQLSAFETEIKNRIGDIVNSTMLTDAPATYRIVHTVGEALSYQQTALLNSLTQAVENPTRAFMERSIHRVADAFRSNKYSTKELKQLWKRYGASMYANVVAEGGNEYGGVGNPFAQDNMFNELIKDKLGKNILANIAYSALNGNVFLNAADSYNKIMLTQRLFVKNMVKLLTNKTNKNRMSHKDALKFVSEGLTGQNYDKSLVEAEKIIDLVNNTLGQEVIQKTPSNIDRMASYVVMGNLATSTTVTAEVVEKAFKASYKSAGLSMGHEANNIVSTILRRTHNYISELHEGAIKEKNYGAATMLKFADIISRVFVNKFAFGGANWVSLMAQWNGVPTHFLDLENFWKHKGKKIDLNSEQGLKDLENVLVRDEYVSQGNLRVLSSYAISAVIVATVFASTDEEEREKWADEHPQTMKYINKLMTMGARIILDLSDGDRSIKKNLLQLIGEKGSFMSDGKRLLKAVSEIEEGGVKEGTPYALGQIGLAVGNHINVPVGSNRIFFDVYNLVREFDGKEAVKPDYRREPKGFWQGFFGSRGWATDIRAMQESKK